MNVVKKLLSYLLVLSLLLGAQAPVRAAGVVDHYRYAAGGSTYVNSVQQVSITIASGSTSNTATINTVGSRSFIIYQGVSTDNTGAAANSEFAYLALTDDHTITATRNASNSDNLVINAAIIDAKAALVDSAQCGTITINGTSSTGNTTITALTLAQSAIFYLGMSNSDTAISPINDYGGVSLTSTTNARFGRGGTSSRTIVAGFCAVQFNSSAVNSVQQIAQAESDTSLTDTDTITSVSTSNTFLAYGGFNTNGASSQAINEYLTLTDATTITKTRAATTNISRTTYYTVTEMKSGVLSNLQRGTITLSSVASNTGSISSATSSRSFANHLGSSISTTAGTAFPKITQTDDTTLTVTRGLASTYTTVTSYEEPTFN